MVNQYWQTEKVEIKGFGNFNPIFEWEFMKAFNRSSFALKHLDLFSRIPSDSPVLHSIQKTQRDNEQTQRILLLNSLTDYKNIPIEERKSKWKGKFSFFIFKFYWNQRGNISTTHQED